MTNLSRRHFIGYSAAATATTVLSSCASNSYKVTHAQGLPVSSYGASSTAEDVTDGMDLSGKVAFITGCNSGIGLETMRVLALRGAHVIGTGRTLEKAQKACDSVSGKTTPVTLELSNLGSVVNCANRVKELNLPIDMLILNAGIGSYGEFQLINGIERYFHINYLGHFLLANHLLPLVQSADHGRIVHVGSQMGYSSVPPEGIDFDNLRGEKSFDSELAYGRSKLANALLSFQLSKQINSTQATSNVIHPGFVKTNIARSAPAFVRIAFDMFGSAIAKTPAQGAATQTYVATAPALAGVSGAYFEDCNPVTINGLHYFTDAAMADKLWRVSTEMCKGFL
ncbi:MAG: NAD(P)-dependent dehydrogenase (short-subunit alcohol dehydrogenase family) [Oceanicoccus sp.]|jgi:NAD(P)-dependent dehydrogenase (short-subunit alcohol dehydrogenase family)